MKLWFSSVTVDEDKLAAIVRIVRERLSMDLVGIDVVIENTTGRYAVIDINVYPSQSVDQLVSPLFFTKSVSPIFGTGLVKVLYYINALTFSNLCHRLIHLCYSAHFSSFHIVRNQNINFIRAVSNNSFRPKVSQYTFQHFLRCCVFSWWCFNCCF